MNILLLDDHAILLDGLEAVLNAEPGYKVVAKMADSGMALAYLKKGGIDLVITDYAMPVMDGADFTRQAKALFPQLKVIILSMHDEPNIIHHVMQTGVDGYVLKKYAQQELLHAIQTVITGRQYCSREVNQSLLKSSQLENRPPELTQREKEILKLLTQELSSREIADKLFISERTVDSHRKNLLRKTNSINIAGLVKFAVLHKHY